MVAASGNIEKELWLSFANGDREAFSQLYRRMYRPLYAYALNCGLDAALAEDAIQEIFAKIYDRPSLVREPATIRPMIYRSVRNYALVWFRGCKRNATMEDIPEAFCFTVAIDEHIVQGQECRRIETKVRALLADVTARQRELLYLRFVRDLSYDEIADLMGITNQGARNMMHKTILGLRRKGEDLPAILLWLATIKDIL